MLTDPPAGIDLLRESVSGLESSPARLEYARSLVELGAALRRTNQRSAARQPLVAGLRLARERGAQRLSAQADQELQARGGRRPRLVAEGRDALHSQRAAGRPARGVGDKCGDRAGPLHQPQDSRDAPLPRLPQARPGWHRVTRATQRGPALEGLTELTSRGRKSRSAAAPVSLIPRRSLVEVWRKNETVRL